MNKNKNWKIPLAGALAGTINAIFGAGGGLILVPLLTYFSNLEEKQIFPTSVAIMLPISAVSLYYRREWIPEALSQGYLYLIGGLLGGIACAHFSKAVPVKWLHRILGILILWGGIKYLC